MTNKVAQRVSQDWSLAFGAGVLNRADLQTERSEEVALVSMTA